MQAYFYHLSLKRFNPEPEVDISKAAVAESTLLTCISHRKVKDAINIYKKISAGGKKNYYKIKLLTNVWLQVIYITWHIFTNS